MGRLPGFVLLLIFCFSTVARLGSQQSLPQTDSDHTEWIAGVLRVTNKNLHEST
jgi:hypothetical protein